MYYNECPKCGAHLDPGERCEECIDKKNKLDKTNELFKTITKDGKNGQIEFEFAS